MTTNKLHFIFISTLISLIFAACGGGEIKNVSFKNDIKPIFNDYCLDCHAGTETQGNIHLDTYENMMKSRYFNNPDPIAIAGQPERSRLYIVVSSNNPGVRMPPKNFGYDPLNEQEIKIIRTWIAEGAKNN